ncbi:hydrophobic protein [Streptomyces hundungensis]
MPLLIVLIVLVLAPFGVGFALHLLWYAAAVLPVLWIVGPRAHPR